MRRMDDHVLVVSQGVPSGGDDADVTNWTLLGIFSNTTTLNRHLGGATQESTISSPIKLEMNKTQYFRQFEHCPTCSGGEGFPNRLAYVIEVHHESICDNGDKLTNWHFEALLPTKVDAHRAMNQIGGRTRVYQVCLPHPKDTFGSDFNQAKNESILQEQHKQNFTAKRRQALTTVMAHSHSLLTRIDFSLRLLIGIIGLVVVYGLYSRN